MHDNDGGQVILVLLWLIILATGSFEAYGRGLETKGKHSVDEDTVFVRQIIISGNKVTKLRVILNELEFQPGDSICFKQLLQVIESSKDNLLNTSLFNFVYITYAIKTGGGIVFHIKVDERWYWWVFPIVEQADRNLSAFLSNGDWSRMNYGVYLKRDNFRGRKELLKVRFRLGFSSQLSLKFDSPSYRRKSGWGLELDVRALNKLSFSTFNNKPVYMMSANKMVQYNYRSSVYYGLRTSLYQHHQIKLSHEAYNIRDTVVLLNPYYLTRDDNNMQFLSLSYQYKFDKRDSKTYPLKGTSVQMDLMQLGLGILNSELKDLNLRFNFQQYVELDRRWHCGSTLEGRLGTSDHLPYVLKKGLGYKTFMNGYELFVIDGTNNVMAQNKMMFTLLEPRVKTIGFMPLTQFAKIHYAFYLKAFFDYGYAWQYKADVSNTMANSFQYGYGLGIDFVTFYDKVLSVNYSVNKLGKHGFFVHFNLEL